MDNVHYMSNSEAALQFDRDAGVLLAIEERSAMALLRLIVAAGVSVSVLGFALSLAT